MIQFMKDSSRTDIDPRKLTLDPIMQARDVELIKDNRLRSSQEIKQASQDKEILEDLRNNVGIRHAITVFVVDNVNYVTDGFHRTNACLKYLKENPNADIKIPALVINNRTYREAFAAAQDANQEHGVGATADEVMQSKFRKLIVEGDYSLTVSEIRERAQCSQGQAAHIARGLKACGEVLAKGANVEFTDAASFTEHLQDRLEMKCYIPSSVWDSKGFPKIRKLSDAISGKGFMGQDDETWVEAQLKGAMNDITRLITSYGDDCFREALRTKVRATGLGISITKRNAWLGQAGSVKGNDVPEGWDGSVPSIVEDDF